MAKKLKPIIVGSRRPTLRETTAIMGIRKKKLAKIKSAVKKLLAQKLTRKEIRERSKVIHAKLAEINQRIIEFKNKALYSEKEEERWQRQLWRLQLLCQHKNKGNERKERDLPPNRHDWTCLDCGFSNWYDNDKEFEKELGKLLATRLKKK